MHATVADVKRLAARSFDIRDPRDVNSAITDEISARLNDEARAGEQPVLPYVRHKCLQSLTQRICVERGIAREVGDSKSASEIHGMQRSTGTTDYAPGDVDSFAILGQQDVVIQYLCPGEKMDS